MIKVRLEKGGAPEKMAKGMFGGLVSLRRK